MLMRKGKKPLTDFKFGTFVGRFLSDGATSMAAKGLIVRNKVTQTVSINNTLLAGTVVSRFWPGGKALGW